MQSYMEGLINVSNQHLNEIMLAQSYQDLTGQVLNRIKIVMGAFERNLLELVMRSGQDLEAIPARNEEEKDLMHGVGPNVTKSAKKDSAQSQDEVDDLLSDLGF